MTDETSPNDEIDHTSWLTAVECGSDVIELMRERMGPEQKKSFDSMVDHKDMLLIIADRIQTYLDRIYADGIEGRRRT
jgi:hypothetical protein